ncbi:MAG: alpha-galactosidase [Propionibacteriaceae bacterium]|jgi:alpha-galactosidase|nr:alpha-galactosidase [Propionibacteriaceae bacterium]
MITVDQQVFQLATANTSYWFRVAQFGHLEHLHYGPRLPSDQSVATLGVKRTAQIGTNVEYDPTDPLYALDTICLEWSGSGCGDYRHSPIDLVCDRGATVSDFHYSSHEILTGPMTSPLLPTAHGGDDQVDTLRVELVDDVAEVELTLDYTVFAATDVIARRATIRNLGVAPIRLNGVASMMVDLPDQDFRLLTLAGAWIKESHLVDQRLTQAMVVNSSTTGISSNRHNPGFMLVEGEATEDHGRAYGFNLVYSGNHASVIERSTHDLVRIETGINPEGFEWILEPGAEFETPQAVMTFSNAGIGEASRHFHDFVNDHVVSSDWRRRARPVVYNNWEATFFDFTQARLLSLARQAKQLGAETFVLDDGWFGARDSDRAGLGDYTINRRKFPQGLGSFADRIRALGLTFGLWMEPEMVNPDSDLYRAHPDWAVTTPGRTPRLGRHQLLLDLTRPEVRDHLVDNISRVLDDTKADYVKWDMNRPISDTFSPTLAHQGEFAHRYMLGLYDVLRRIFSPRPHILLESCASGGNRFDLGMLCFSPQIWSSDDTDPIERLRIQGGLSLLYPPSTMGAHVSESPHQQTLRDTPLTTRFNVAAFGCLGYELDLDHLSPIERKEIREQIAFYIQHRQTLQYGHHHRTTRGAGAKPNKVVWTMVATDGSEAITGLFQTLSQASEGPDQLVIDGLEAAGRYSVATRPQSLFISRFGGLVKHIAPIQLNPDGVILRTVTRRHRLIDCVEQYEAYGALLTDGIWLNNQFMGTGYNPQTRLLSDFGSNLYLTTRQGDGVAPAITR